MGRLHTIALNHYTHLSTHPPSCHACAALQDPGLPCWTNEADCDGDPPRLWSPNGLFPGTAFTRSIGDSGVVLLYTAFCRDSLLSLCTTCTMMFTSSLLACRAAAAAAAAGLQRHHAGQWAAIVHCILCTNTHYAPALPFTNCDVQPPRTLA